MNDEMETNKDTLKDSDEIDKNKLSSWGFPKQILSYYLRKGISRFFDWQVTCLQLQGILEGQRNLVFSAPTSAGKTMISDVLLFKTLLERKKKVIIILPFVSIVFEKVQALKKLCRSLGFRIASFAGSVNPPGGLLSVDVAVCTIEKANNMINRLIEEKKVSDFGLIVVDELHMIGDESRGYILEILLSKLIFMKQNKMPDVDNLQIIGMSATLPNLRSVADWLNAELFITDYRPVPLTQHVVLNNEIYTVEPKDQTKFEPSQQSTPYDENLVFVSLRKLILDDIPIVDHPLRYLVYLAIETVVEGYSTLIFCPTRSLCENLSTMISKNIFDIGSKKNTPISDRGKSVKERLIEAFNFDKIQSLMKLLEQYPTGSDDGLRLAIRFGCGYHHAGLTMEERAAVEQAFRDGTLKVLCCTTTLSAGVNLPARRVIITSPFDFTGNAIDISKYRQMIGRAGRKGIDILGESFLFCSNEELKDVKTMLNSKLKPVRSCLIKSKFNSEIGIEVSTTDSLLRTVLEVIAIGLAKSQQEFISYLNHTFFLKHASCDDIVPKNTVIEKAVLLAANKLIVDKCIQSTCYDQSSEVTQNPDEFVITSFGKAIIASGISPLEASFILKELQRCMEKLCLLNDLHLVYETTPPYMSSELSHIDWKHYLNLYDQMDDSMKVVAGLIGVKKSYLLSQINRFTINDETKHMIHKRFYASLALYDLVQEVPIHKVQLKYGLSRGLLQSLQQRASTFAGMLAAFCNRLGWSSLELLIEQFQPRLSFGVQRELIDLLRIPCMNSDIARRLFAQGYETVISLIYCKPIQIENVLLSGGNMLLHGAQGSSNVKNDELSMTKLYVSSIDGYVSVRQLSKMIIEEARILVEETIGQKLEFGPETPDTVVPSKAKLTPSDSETSFISSTKTKRIRTKKNDNAAEDDDDGGVDTDDKNDSVDADNYDDDGRVDAHDKNDAANADVDDDANTSGKDDAVNADNADDANTDGKDDAVNAVSEVDVTNEEWLNIQSSTPKQELKNKKKSETPSSLFSLGNTEDCSLSDISDLILPESSIQNQPKSKCSNLKKEIQSKKQIESNKSDSLSTMSIDMDENLFKDFNIANIGVGDSPFRLQKKTEQKSIDQKDFGTQSSNKDSISTSRHGQESIETISMESFKDDDNVETFFRLLRSRGEFYRQNQLPLLHETKLTPDDVELISVIDDAESYLKKIFDQDLSNKTITLAMYFNLVPRSAERKRAMIVLDPKSRGLSIKPSPSSENENDYLPLKYSPNLALGGIYIAKLHQKEAYYFHGGLVLRYLRSNWFEYLKKNIQQQQDQTEQSKPLRIICYDLKQALQCLHEAFDFPRTFLAYTIDWFDCMVALWLLDPSESSIPDLISEKTTIEDVGKIALKHQLDAIYFHRSMNSLKKNLNYAEKISTQSKPFPATLNNKLKTLVLFNMVYGLLVKLRERNFYQSYIMIEIPSRVCLFIMETNETLIDRTYLYKLRDELIYLQNCLSKKIFAEVGYEFHLNSPDKVAKVLYGKCGLITDYFNVVSKSPAGKKKTHNLGTSKATLYKIQESCGRKTQLPLMIIEWRKLQHVLRNTIYSLQKSWHIDDADDEYDHDDDDDNNNKASNKLAKIYCRCFEWTVTGRITMHEPNLINIDKDFEITTLKDLDNYPHPIPISIRKILIAPANHRLVCADYCQLELRILAHFSEDPQLLSALDNDENKDVFKLIASRWQSTPYDQVTGGQRQQVKQICYGIIYGMGDDSLAEKLGVTKEEAIKCRESFFEKYHRLKSFMDSVVEKSSETGYVETISGRRRTLVELVQRSSITNFNHARRQAVNTKIQGSAADILKIAMIAVQKQIDRLNLRAKFILQMHDELMYQVDEKDLKRFSMECLKYQMENVSHYLQVSLPVKVSHGLNWSEMEEF